MSDQPPYVVSAAYQRPNRSKTVYTQLEALIADQSDVDLSAYNLQLNGQPLVIVLGNPPSGAIREAIQRIMATGQPSEVPATVLAALYRRSLSGGRTGPGVSTTIGRARGLASRSENPWQGANALPDNGVPNGTPLSGMVSGIWPRLAAQASVDACYNLS